MPNVLRITVENASELLNAGAYDAGALVRVQWAATEAGTFADIAGTGATPTIPLVAGTRVYVGYDPAGTSSVWYRTRYENVGATRLSDWSAAFQVGAETGAFLCSLYDAKQRLGIAYTDTSEDENILGYIAQVSHRIESVTGRWFVPRPLSGTTTYVLDGPTNPLELWVPVGIRSITTLGYATTDQPDTGGTYTTIGSAFYSLGSAIERSPSWPATRIRLLLTAPGRFYEGLNTVQIVGSFGWAAVPPDIEQVALNLVVAAHRERAISGGEVVVTEAGGERRFPAGLSRNDRRVLEWYAVVRV